MFPINTTGINTEIRKPTAKTALGKTTPVIGEEYKKSVWNMIDALDTSKAYNLGQWVKFIAHWIRSKGRINTQPLPRGSIIFMELGSMNVQTEFSYEHPCVVLQERPTKVLVIPGSTKKYGVRKSEIISVDTTSGFPQNTGLLMEDMRWLHKNRITSGRIVGTVTQPILDQIDQYILDRSPLYLAQRRKFKSDIATLRSEKYAADQALVALQETHDNLVVEKETQLGIAVEYSNQLQSQLESLQKRLEGSNQQGDISSIVIEMKKSLDQVAAVFVKKEVE